MPWGWLCPLELFVCSGFPDLYHICLFLLQIFKIYLLFVYFDYAGSLLPCGLFSGCSEWGLLSGGSARASQRRLSLQSSGSRLWAQ